MSNSGVLATVVAATSAVSKALTGNPMCLSAVILSGIMASLIFVVVREQQQQDHATMLQLINMCQRGVQ